MKLKSGSNKLGDSLQSRKLRQRMKTFLRNTQLKKLQWRHLPFHKIRD